MRLNGPRASRAELVLLAALAAWGLVPLILLLVQAASLHARFTGADGLIGADGVLGADQLQYLAWIRDASAHGLASDLFTLSPTGHVYLEPVFAISGALLHLGLSLPLAYLVWKPVAIVAMFAATVAWARRAFGDRLAARAAAVALSLFLYTPLAALVNWTQSGPGPFRFEIYQLAGELMAAGGLWGYVPGALAFALVPVALLAVERALDPGAGRRVRTRPPSAGSAGRPRGAVAVAAGASLLASWLHPWQGITLVLIFVGLAALRRLDGWLTLALVAAAAALPLGYYDLLPQIDPAWRLASQYEQIGHLEGVVVLAGLGPPALVAAFGVRRPAGVFEQVLLLWVAACLVNYFVNDSFAPHALQGLSLPLSVLIVRGWSRLRPPAVVGAAAIALITLPGLAYDARKLVRTFRSPLVQYYLPGPDARALDWIALSAPAGGVLAPPALALVVPSQTGRAVWVGHGYWSQDYFGRAQRVDALMRGRMRPAQAQAFVAGTGAALVVEDCGDRPDLGHVLGPLVASTHHFGCARVYVLRRSHPAAALARTTGLSALRADRLPVGEAVHESQPRPGLVDRADLVVDEAGGESQLAHDAVGEVGVLP